MKKFLIIALAISLGGCSTPFGQKISAFVESVKIAATATVSPEAIYVARNAFDAVEVSATNYLLLDKCPIKAPFCRDPSATAKLVPAIRAGRVARNNATQFLTDHPGQLGAQGLMDALTASTDAIKQILSNYHVGS